MTWDSYASSTDRWNQEAQDAYNRQQAIIAEHQPSVNFRRLDNLDWLDELKQVNPREAEWWNRYYKKQDASARPWEEARANARSDEIGEAYAEYQNDREDRGMPRDPSGQAFSPAGGAYVPDWSLRGGEWKQGPPTEGNALAERQSRMPITIARGTEFEQRIPSFSELSRQSVFDDDGNIVGRTSGRASHSVGTARQIDELSMQDKLSRKQMRNLGKAIPEDFDLSEYLKDFDPADYPLYTKSPLDLLNKGLSSIGAGVEVPNPSFTQAASMGPMGVAMHSAMNQPLDPRLLLLELLGMKGAGKLAGSGAKAALGLRNARGVMVGEGAGPFSATRPPKQQLQLPYGGQDFQMQPSVRPTARALPRGIDDQQLQLPWQGPQTVDLSHAGYNLPSLLNENPGALEYALRTKELLRDLINQGSTSGVGRGWKRGSY